MDTEQHDIAELIRSNQLRDELIPIKRLPDLIPSSRPGVRLALPTIYRWILKGKLKTRKIGGSLYVTVDDLVDFIRPGQPAGDPRSRSPQTSAGAARRAGDELDRLLATKAPSRSGAQSPRNIKASA